MSTVEQNREPAPVTIGLSEDLGRFILGFALVDDNSGGDQIRAAVKDYIGDAPDNDYFRGVWMAMRTRVVSQHRIQFDPVDIQSLEQLASTYETNIDIQIRMALMRYFDSRLKDPTINEQIERARERDGVLSRQASVVDLDRYQLRKQLRNSGIFPTRNGY